MKKLSTSLLTAFGVSLSQPTVASIPSSIPSANRQVSPQDSEEQPLVLREFVLSMPRRTELSQCIDQPLANPTPEEAAMAASLRAFFRPDPISELSRFEFKEGKSWFYKVAVPETTDGPLVNKLLTVGYDSKNEQSILIVIDKDDLYEMPERVSKQFQACAKPDSARR